MSEIEAGFLRSKTGGSGAAGAATDLCTRSFFIRKRLAVNAASQSAFTPLQVKPRAATACPTANCARPRALFCHHCSVVPLALAGKYNNHYTNRERERDRKKERERAAGACRAAGRGAVELK